MATSDSTLELEVEEQMFYALLHGSLEVSEVQLRQLENVDVRGVRGRTLLHVAVRLGKADWVESLLGIGADPRQRDGNELTVLQAAEEMSTKHPEDADRKVILQLVRLVHERETKRELGSNGGGVAARDSTPPAPGMDPAAQQKLLSAVSSLSKDTTTIKESLEELRNQMTTQNKLLAHHVLSSPPEPSREEENYSRDVSLLRDCVEDMRSQVMSLKSGQSASERRLFSLKEAVEEVRGGLSARDVVLDALEVSVTSMAEEWRPLKESLKEASEKPNGVRGELQEMKDESAGSIRILLLEPEKFTEVDCVGAMMRKTKVAGSDVAKVRSAYGKLYNASSLTKCILVFLHFQPRFQVVVGYPHRELTRRRNGAGVEDASLPCDAGTTSVDLSEMVVRLRGGAPGRSDCNEDYFVGDLAWSLAQLSICLAFKNRGRPYYEGDDHRERQYSRILQDAEEKKRRGGVDLGHYVIDALKKGTKLAKEIEFVAAVPGIIALYGCKWGTSQLRRKLSSLLDFYEHYVAATLSGESEV